MAQKGRAQTRSIHQDRLGTNTGKAETREAAFPAGLSVPPPAGRATRQISSQGAQNAFKGEEIEGRKILCVFSDLNASVEPLEDEEAKAPEHL